MTAAVPFRFNAENHEYIDLATGQLLPHITGMLQAAGLIDSTWFTEESSIRGRAVHSLTAEYDLGALEDPESLVSRHKPYLLAHVAAMRILKPEILAVEEPAVHQALRFAGRPDRLVRIDGVCGVLEIKTTAGPDHAHEVQTAMQCILVNEQLELPAAMLRRWALYLKPTGRFKLLEHTRAHDYTEAYRLIREFCR